jgi:pimeloyl-ACP methyl ester carboxylesterase
VDFTIEQHLADAIAILDLFEQEKSWAIGHSWGAHLALHLAVAHPERLYGIVCIDPVAANEAVLPEFRENLRAQLTGEERARVEEIEEHEADGTVTEEELLEKLRILWPAYFFDKSKVPPTPIDHLGIEASIEANRSMLQHFEARTLKRGVGKIAMPALFVHGIQDPLPLRASLQTAKRIPGARVARVANCGHLPWLEQPGFVNRYIRGLIATL